MNFSNKSIWPIYDILSGNTPPEMIGLGGYGNEKVLHRSPEHGPP